MTETNNKDIIEVKNQSKEQNTNSNATENFTDTNNSNYKYKTESGLFWLLLVFGIFFSSFIFVFQVILTPIKVIGTSMQPTINKSVIDENDEIHTDIVYFSAQNKYFNNDIVIVDNKNNNYIESSSAEPVTFLIKRVVAISGQTIKFTKSNNHPLATDKLYYEISVYDENGNNINLNQSYLDEEMYYSYNYIDELSKYSLFNQIFSSVIENGSYSLQIPNDTYFVMGDNRNGSWDSRLFGCVKNEDISGKVHLIVPYGKNMFSAICSKIFGSKNINHFKSTKFVTA